MRHGPEDKLALFITTRQWTDDVGQTSDVVNGNIWNKRERFAMRRCVRAGYATNELIQLLINDCLPRKLSGVWSEVRVCLTRGKSRTQNRFSARKTFLFPPDLAHNRKWIFSSLISIPLRQQTMSRLERPIRMPIVSPTTAFDCQLGVDGRNSRLAHQFMAKSVSLSKHDEQADKEIEMETQLAAKCVSRNCSFDFRSSSRIRRESFRLILSETSRQLRSVVWNFSGFG